MGNSSSGQQQHISLIEGPTHPWAHSFPRSSSFKVLPERVPGQRLRLTNNGAILHNGGTISGRKPYEQGFRQSGSDFEERRYMYSSEPDLRFTGSDQHHHRSRQSYVQTNNNTNYYNGNNDSSAKSRIGRSRKKYKAPTAPNINNSTESSSPDSFNQWETSGDSSEVAPVRKSRLFKTRAETKKPSEPSSRAVRSNGKVPGQLQRSFSSPQFHDELTAKLKERLVREPPVGKAADSPNSSPMTNRKEIQTGLIDNNNRHDDMESKRNKQMNYYREENNNRKTGNYNVREGRLNKNIEMNKNNQNQRNQQKTEKQVFKTSTDKKIITNNKTPIKQTAKLTNGINKENEDKTSINKKSLPKADEKPVKKFYFGMEQAEDNKLSPSKFANRDNEIIDKFAESVKKCTPGINSTSTSETVSTSDEAASGGIFLKLRPTLPRKQLDIPRFSPTAAWRLLSALESPVNSEDDDLMLMEERIPHPREINQDKSGDSGISGDASPNSAHNSQAAWTPQQDLEETSSDGGVESAPVSPESITTAKFSPRFSLSLPRDEKNDIYSYSDHKVRQDAPSSGNFQNIKKFKWSSSNGNHIKQKNTMVSSLDENWVLSRSVPNLFNPTHINKRSDTSISPPDQEESSMCSLTTGKPPSLSYLATGGRVMYLPEYQSRNNSRKLTEQKADQVSKSCEDLTKHKKETNVSKPHKTSSKFTFQSTIRQIERRKIAEKLSKDAEEKEKRRLRELEAMQRVEEEFQRKREREKADIRQQLRLYNLTEGREQPDGAVMGNGLPTTQILSEFRQPRREYRDYTPRNDTENVPQVELNVKRETVHPEVVYQMPKSTQVYVTSRSGSASMNHADTISSSSASDNYRKDFAQGALSRSLVGSDCDSQPNTRPTSRTKHRSRSISPVNDNDDDFNTNSQFIINQSPWDNHTYDMNLSRKSNDLSESPITLPRRSMQFSLKPFSGLKTYKPINFKLDNFKRIVR